MCIIIAKHSETKLDKSFLLKGIEQSWNTNSHGAGYAIKSKESNTIWIDKGYFDKDQFLSKMESEIQDDDDFIIHLRLATSGNKDDINCHPFIISTNVKELETVEGHTKKAVIAHNGVISEFTDRKSDHSDTFRFVQYQLSMWIPKFYSSLLNNIGHNKFAVLDPKKGLSVYGNFIRERGIYFSNGGYKKYSYPSVYGYSEIYH